PITRLGLVHFRGEDETFVTECAHGFHQYLAPHLPPGVQMHDPVPSPIARKKDEFYFQILFTVKQMPVFSRFLRKGLRHYSRYLRKRYPRSRIRIYVDIDPTSLI
ncbi:MAG: hypothetical protein D6820_10115, partial [Lentisphaerae bacterium]